MPETAERQRRVRAVLAESTHDEVVLTFPGTSYQMHLRVLAPVNRPLGKRIEGMIQAQARRIDVVGTGGRYVEPVYGKPRRVQGSIVAVDAAKGTLTVDAGMPIVCRTNGIQQASDFKVGDLVTFEVAPGAVFTVA
jgi:hypothetical protein